VFGRDLSENKSMKQMRGARVAASLCGILLFLLCPPVRAQTVPDASSTSYSIDQVYMGAGGQMNACSTTFCSNQTVGETAVGNISGTAFQAIAGSNTKREPYIAFSTVGGTTDLGTLSVAGTATATATFAVKTYLAHGYTVLLASDPPTTPGSFSHTFNTPSTPTASATPGTQEQFGINLVANSTGCATPAPANFGANPVQVPGGTFSYGAVAADYATCGKFKYVKGDSIASSTKSSGETDFTMSFIYNITNLTPDGQYTFNGDLVAVSTY
jgi:hypothetical protein